MRHLPIILLMACCLVPTAGSAQENDRFYPLHHHDAAGKAGQWAVAIRPTEYGYYQPVQIQLPTIGHVSYYVAGDTQPTLTQAPSQVGMALGHVYRVRISGMPEFPGIELYPTIEIIDRLHPPEGRTDEFPVPISITDDEVELALQDRLVTKVIYLETPQHADPQAEVGEVRVQPFPSTANILKTADQLGRPMAIIRIGGRIPISHGDNSSFFGNAPPLIMPTRTAEHSGPTGDARQ